MEGAEERAKQLNDSLNALEMEGSLEELARSKAELARVQAQEVFGFTPEHEEEVLLLQRCAPLIKTDFATLFLKQYTACLPVLVSFFICGA